MVKELRAEVDRLESRADVARCWYQVALKNMLTWNGYPCRILAPAAALPLVDGAEISLADVGLIEPSTGMLIVRVDGGSVELAFHSGQK